MKTMRLKEGSDQFTHLFFLKTNVLFHCHTDIDVRDALKTVPTNHSLQSIVLKRGHVFIDGKIDIHVANENKIRQMSYLDTNDVSAVDPFLSAQQWCEFSVGCSHANSEY